MDSTETSGGMHLHLDGEIIREHKTRIHRSKFKVRIRQKPII